MNADATSAVSAGTDPDREQDGTAAAPRTGLWAVGVGLIATLVSFAGSWTPSIWNDEAATISAATRSWADLLRLLREVDVVHGAYYSLMHVWFDLFGVSAITLRLPSAIAVGLAAAGVVVLGTTTSRLRVGIYSGLVFAILPRVTWMGTEGRSSAVSTAAAVWITILLLAALRRPGRAPWIWYALAVGLASSLWIYLALLVVAHGLAIAWFGSASRSRDLRAWAISAACGFLLVGPVVLLAKQQSGQVSWIQRPGLDTAKSVLVEQWFGTDGFRSLPLAMVCWIVMAVALIALLRNRNAEHGISLRKLAFPWLIFPTAALLAYSMVLTPIYFPKYVAFCVPAVALIVGEMLARIRRTWLRNGALIALAVLAIPSYLSERSPTAKDGSDWAAVAQIVEQTKADGDAVLYRNLYNSSSGTVRSPARVIAYSYPQAFSGLADVGLDQLAGPTAELWDSSTPIPEVTARLAPFDRLWVISDFTAPLTAEGDKDLAALQDAGFEVSKQWHGSKTDVFLLTRVAAGG